MTNRLDPGRGWGALLLAPLAFAMCRDFSVREDSQTTGGGGSSGDSSALGGAAGDDNGGTNSGGRAGSGEGAQGDGGAAGNGTGGALAGASGRAGAATGGVGGESGAGEGGGGNGGGGNGGEDSGPDGLPGIFGAVRLFVDGKPKCGGTLITNSWILTVDRCISEKTPLSGVSVGFGMDSSNLEQVRRAVEVVPFPGGGTPDVPSLILLGVDAPFSLDGSTTGHSFPLWFSGPDLLGTHRCVGWDLMPEPTSPTNRLRTTALTAIAVTADPIQRVWWTNSDLYDRAHGSLLTGSDLGAGCFRRVLENTFLTTVHGGNPTARHDGAPNQDEEAFSLSVAQPGIQTWVDNRLFRVLPETQWTVAGEVAVCSFSADTLEVFSLGDDGSVHWRTQTGWPSARDEPWVEQPPLPPPDGVTLASDRPGVLCAADGSIELFARASDDTVWWQRRRLEGWASTWSIVDQARATSGLTVVGVEPSRFHLFARGVNHELRHSEHAGSSWLSEWQDFGGNLEGPPSARIANTAWLDVYMRDVYGNLADLYYYFGPPSWGVVGSATSDPAVVSWNDERVDVFMRNEDDRLRRVWFAVGVGAPPPVDTELTLPPGRLNAVSREPGKFDVFVSAPGRPVWHAVWPREPGSSSEPSP